MPNRTERPQAAAPFTPSLNGSIPRPLLWLQVTRRVPETLRTETFADPDFRAEGERMGLGLNAPRTGEELQTVIARAYQSPPRIIERLQKLNNP